MPQQEGKGLARLSDSHANVADVPGEPGSRKSSSVHESKRQKLDHSVLPESVKMISTQNMWHFERGSVVDLTSSPPSPKRQSLGPRDNNASKYASNDGRKTFTLKSSRTNPVPIRPKPTDVLQTAWPRLEQAIHKVFNSAPDQKLAVETTYKEVSNVVRSGAAQQLHEKLLKSLTHQLRDIIVPKTAQDSALEDNNTTLRRVLGLWSAWSAQMRKILSMFYFLDRAYLVPSPSQLSIEQTTVNLFKEEVFEHQQFHARLLNGTTDLLSNARLRAQHDEESNRMFQQTVHMFYTLGVYGEYFEPKVLSASSTYFQEWSDNAVKNHDLKSYIAASVALMEKEKSRCETFKLDESTKRGFERLLEDMLIQRHIDFLVDTQSVSQLLDANDDESLTNLFELLEKKNFTKKLQTPFGTYVFETGTNIVFDEKCERFMVVRLLNYRRKLARVLENCFKDDSDLRHLAREKSTEFMNQTRKTEMTHGFNNDKAGEMIAKYLDLILRGGAKAVREEENAAAQVVPELKDAASVSVTEKDEADNDDVNIDDDAEVNAHLDQALDLFRFLQGKAVFEAFYKKDLAKRLLLGRSASADAEKRMLQRLKENCGEQFTHNLEQMFRDLELARDEQANFKDMTSARETKPTIDLETKILSAASWPEYGEDTFILPQGVETIIEEYQTYYKMRHTGRTLTWKHQLAHCQLRSKFRKGNKEMVVSGYQAGVLLQFNVVAEGETLDFQSLQTKTGLHEADLRRTLQSLACGHFRILNKTPKGRDVSKTDVFAVNEDFSNPKIRFKINQVQLKETKEENKKTHERVAADRQYETQAAIVRIMKGKQKIAPVLLMTEVINALKKRGAVSPDDINIQIAKLIEKDYMEKNDEDGLYHYVA